MLKLAKLYRLAINALSSANPIEVIKAVSSRVNNPPEFNTKIPLEGAPITNQRASGRCWLFAATNVFRVPIMKKRNLESLELSQKYLFYYDKLEKSNWFLEHIIDTAGEDVDSRIVQRLLENIVGDGGQWDMVYNLVTKYGLVPQAIYPETWSAQNSRFLKAVLGTKLREFALTLRQLSRSDGATSQTNITNSKTRMMQEIQKILTFLLGPPPNPMDEFTWQYTDKEGKVHELRTTPMSFAQDTCYSEPDCNINNMVSLVHDPRHHPLSLLTVSRLGNVIGGRDTTYVNVDMDTLKTACVAMIQAAQPIFFGCDFGKFQDKVNGILDIDNFDYEAGIGTDMLHMTKRERLVMSESRLTHAMVITAVHLCESTGKPTRWKVQNSHGSDSGNKGWYVMTDAWMDEFVYQVVIDLRFVSEQVREVMKQDPIVLPLWDPIGALA